VSVNFSFAFLISGDRGEFDIMSRCRLPTGYLINKKGIEAGAEAISKLPIHTGCKFVPEGLVHTHCIAITPQPTLPYASAAVNKNQYPYADVSPSQIKTRFQLKKNPHMTLF
jgi:hypothetical protein